MSSTTTTLSTFLVIPNNAIQEAIDFYLRIFPSGTATLTSRSPSNPTLAPITATLSIYGHTFILLGSGPPDPPSPAVSFFLTCTSGQQSEIDGLWEGLKSDGGEESRCGWVKDRFGFFWQVVPKELGQLLQSDDKEKAGRVMRAMLGMRKLNIQGLLDAAEGKEAGV